MRITVNDVLGWLAHGMTEDEILDDHPGLDQNLSPRLISKLADILPGLEAVYDHNLVGAADRFIFEWARRSNFTAVITTDRDSSRS
jgi:hypothetical protein